MTKERALEILALHKSGVKQPMQLVLMAISVVAAIKKPEE